MPATPVVRDEFGNYDIIDLRISMKDPHPKGFASDDPAMRLINAMEKEIERLQRRCEIYASGLTAIADPLPGSTDGVLIRTAINTLRRVEQEAG